MAQSPGIARVCSDHSLRYDRVARLARGREVCWNFYSLLEAQPTFSCTWMNGELWREITQTRRNVWVPQYLLPFLSKWVEALNEIPHSFSATFYRTASVKFDPRDLFLWSFQTSFVANLCKFYLIINWGESLRDRDLHLHSPEYLGDKNKLLLLDFAWRLTRSLYHFPCTWTFIRGHKQKIIQYNTDKCELALILFSSLLV